MTEKKPDEREVTAVLIVDPKSLGMEGQAGVAPPKAAREGDERPDIPLKDPVHVHSLNEPPGSEIMPEPEPPPPEARGKAAVPPRDRDDIEGEIEDAVDDGDVEIKPKKKK